MAYYQFRPAVPKRIWALTLFLLAICLGGPVIAAKLVPVIDTKPTPVLLGSEEEGWSIQLHDATGAPVKCLQTVGDVVEKQWDCDGTTISTMLYTGSEDQNNTFQRYLRLKALQPSDVQHRGHLRAAHNDTDAGAVSLARTINDTEYTLCVYLQGNNFQPLYTTVLEQLSADVAEQPQKEAQTAA
ncbi:hypothetical protein [Corynebacterium gerontici]|uniref:Uncharacterized protein n=1 Tax=Corynebacterium gerontici TaxID=2079234 RepID=A0A3G6IXN7_9CORY|nr:hypothetical protein [Corynebacterium gerontici]AZA10452.1 hypothetical protein CGERO_00570 [Corynebacterium gerontici]